MGSGDSGGSSDRRSGGSGRCCCQRGLVFAFGAVAESAVELTYRECSGLMGSEGRSGSSDRRRGDSSSGRRCCCQGGGQVTIMWESFGN